MIKISLQESLFSDIINDMRSKRPWASPDGVFYLTKGNITPFTNKPTVIKVETNRIDEPIDISVIYDKENQVGTARNQSPKSITAVARSEVFNVGIHLGQGINKITARVSNREEEVSYLIVNATTIVTLWEAFARLLFTEGTRAIENQKGAIYSQFGTRLIEPFIKSQDLLPDVQSLQVLSTRLLARGFVHEVGRNAGVTDLLKAFTLSTPVYRPMIKETSLLNLVLDPYADASSQLSGKEAHVWMPNVGIASWQAFINFLSSHRDLYHLKKISEDEVVFDFQGETQKHRFDFDSFGTDFLTSLAVDDCFKSIIPFVSVISRMKIKFCAASYTFDLFVTEDTPIGNRRLSLDGGMLDSGVPFDSDVVDPFADGWVGLSLTGRFERDHLPHGFDTFVVNSSQYSGNECVYSGHYTQLLQSQRSDIEVPIDVAITNSYIQTAIMWTLEAPNGSKWNVRVHPDGTLFTEPNSIHDVSNFKVTKPDLSEASFRITNSGILQVISPPDLSADDLNDSIYLRAPGGGIWDVNVNNDNTLHTVKVFPV